MQKLFYLLVLCYLPLGLFGPAHDRFYEDLSNAWQEGNARSLAILLDQEVDFSRGGREVRYRREQVEEVLQTFFEEHQPAGFRLKHKGSSQNGQLYVVGRFNTSEGGSYKVVCRARRVSAAYRIFQLDIQKGPRR